MSVCVHFINICIMNIDSELDCRLKIYGFGLGQCVLDCITDNCFYFVA